MFSGAIYRNCNPDRLDLVKSLYSDFSKRIEQLPNSMQLEQNAFIEINAQCNSLDKFEPIIHVKYKEKKPKTLKEVKIKINKKAIQNHGYKKWPSGIKWRKFSKLSTAGVYKEKLCLNPKGYKKLYLNGKYTQKEARMSAFATDVHETLHLKQDLHPGLFFFKKIGMQKLLEARKPYNSWARCTFFKNNKAYLSEKIYFEKLWEALNKSSDPQQFLKIILLESLKEQQAILSDIPLQPLLKRSRVPIGLFASRYRQVAFLDRVFDETLVQYKKRGFD